MGMRERVWGRGRMGERENGGAGEGERFYGGIKNKRETERLSGKVRERVMAR